MSLIHWVPFRVCPMGASIHFNDEFDTLCGISDRCNDFRKVDCPWCLQDPEFQLDMLALTDL